MHFGAFKENLGTIRRQSAPTAMAAHSTRKPAITAIVATCPNSYRMTDSSSASLQKEKEDMKMPTGNRKWPADPPRSLAEFLNELQEWTGLLEEGHPFKRIYHSTQGAIVLIEPDGRVLLLDIDTAYVSRYHIRVDPSTL